VGHTIKPALKWVANVWSHLIVGRTIKLALKVGRELKKVGKHCLRSNAQNRHPFHHVPEIRRMLPKNAHDACRVHTALQSLMGTPLKAE